MSARFKGVQDWFSHFEILKFAERCERVFGHSQQLRAQITKTMKWNLRAQVSECPMVVIVPRLPPAVCGLADYTRKLLWEMKLEPKPHILVMTGADATRAAHPELDIEQIPADGSRLVARLVELRAERVLVEYVGQGFQSRGCPLWLLGALRRWRLATPGARLVVMFQELWFEPAWWRPDWLLQKLHRRALRRLVPVLDQTFLSTAGYGRWLADVAAPENLAVLPNATNIPPVASPAEARRDAGAWILFGRQGSRLAALGEIAPWLEKLHTARRLRTLQLVGSRESGEMNAREDALIASLLPPGAFEMLGPQSPERLSRIFLAAEFGIFTQSPASYTKSTIFMAYASHGVHIVSPNTMGAKKAPQCWVTHPSELLAGTSIPSGAIADRGLHLAEWYDQNASWPRIAAAYRSALGFPASP